MSFYLYRQIPENGYERIEPIRLTGPEGLIARYLQSHQEEETPFPWQLSSNDLVDLHNPELDPAEHLIVLDMLPESLTEICLYRITHLQGSSDWDESDVVLASKMLYQGRVSLTNKREKLQVARERPDAENRQMLEALRLTGGMQKGHYFWAKPKMDIGAAICPAAVSA